MTTRSFMLMLCVVAALPLAFAVPKASVAKTVSFSDTVVHEERYEHKISDLYLFELTPQVDGWWVNVFTPGYPKDSLTVFTPPIHCCPFEQEIIPQNFVGPWFLRPERTIIFSVKILDLQRRFGGDPRPSDIAEIARDGTADVSITDISLANVADRSRMYIKRMTFNVKITFNPKPYWKLSRN